MCASLRLGDVDARATPEPSISQRLVPVRRHSHPARAHHMLGVTLWPMACPDH
jgi:hypothetical protein